MVKDIYFRICEGWLVVQYLTLVMASIRNLGKVAPVRAPKPKTTYFRMILQPNNVQGEYIIHNYDTQGCYFRDSTEAYHIPFYR